MPTWLAQVGQFLLAKFATAFPNIVGVLSSIVAALPRQEAEILHEAMKFFHQQIAEGASWEEAFTATMNKVQTAELKLLTEEAKHLLQAFMHKAKP